jgi:hypothetical protein
MDQRQAARIIPVSLLLTLLLMHPNLLIFEHFQSDSNFAKEKMEKAAQRSFNNYFVFK